MQSVHAARVPVISVDGKPLSPTKPKKARAMLEGGVAKKIFIDGHFALQMLREVGSVIPHARESSSTTVSAIS